MIDSCSECITFYKCIVASSCTTIKPQCAMEHQPSFCIKRKRNIDAVKTENFLKDSADSDDETPLSDVFDWMDPVPIKRATIALEDSSSKRKRLKEEG